MKIKDLKIMMAFDDMKDKQTAFEEIFVVQAGEYRPSESENGVWHPERFGEIFEGVSQPDYGYERCCILATVLRRYQRTNECGEELQTGRSER